jgi:hypothetical protein
MGKETKVVGTYLGFQGKTFLLIRKVSKKGLPPFGERKEVE